MAKKRSSNDSNPRLKLDYREYMNLYKEQKTGQGEPRPAADEGARFSGESAFEPADDARREKQSPQTDDLTNSSYESAQGDEAESVRAPVYEEERFSAAVFDDGEDLEDPEDDPDALDIQNPFMDMFRRAKHLTKKASDYMNAKNAEDNIETLYFDEAEEQEIDESTDDGESGWTRFLAMIGFKQLGDEDLSEDELRRKYKKLKANASAESEFYHQSFEANAGDKKIIEEIDPVFTMDSEFAEEIVKKPAGRKSRRKPHERAADNEPPIMTKQNGRTYITYNDEIKLNGEGVDVMAGEQNNSNDKRYNDMLGYATSETPSMSRRERKARETTGKETSTKKYPQAKPEHKLPAYNDIPIDEPTQEFKPVRVRPDQRAKEAAPEQYYDEYDEYDEEDDAPVRVPASKKQRKQRVYSDYDDEYEQDEYDEEYEDEYDDQDYDEEDEDDDERNSLGHHILGFLKALFAIVIILIVLLLALRLLENASIVSLDAVRDSIGKYVPIEVILPKPEDNSSAPEQSQMPADADNQASPTDGGADDFTDDVNQEGGTDDAWPSDGDAGEADGSSFG